MASNLKLAAAAKNAALVAAYSTQVGASGLMRWYSGTQPTNPDTALSGNTKLAELPLSATSGTASAGVFTFNAITTESSADATGTATFGSFLTSGGTRIADFTIGTSGADLNLNTTSIVAGAAASCSSATVTNGN
jgi:hypothetical protein